MRKKFVKTVLMSALLAQICWGANASAAEQYQPVPKDIAGHWSESTITNWSEKGYVRGYEDGSFHPDAPITRAEFAELVNRVFAFRTSVDLSYRDVVKEDWFYESLSRAEAAGYLSGYEDETVKPNQAISRQEAAVILSKLLPEKTIVSDLNYLDRNQLPQWALSGIAKVAALGIMNGYPDQTFQGLRPITRAESIVALNKALEAWGYVYDKKGIYGYDNPNQALEHNVTIDAASTIVENMIIVGDLTISEKVGDGNVTLKNVTVKGNVRILGGGQHSIHLQDSTLENVFVNRSDGPVRIVSEGRTEVTYVKVMSSALLEQPNNVAAGKGFRSVVLGEEMPADSKVSLIGDFREMKVEAKKIQVDLTNGSLDKLTMATGAAQSTVKTGKTTRIAELRLDAVVEVKGDGRIDKAVINEGAKGSSIETKPGISEGAGISEPKPTGGATGAPIPPVIGNPGGGSNSGGIPGGGNNGGNSNGSNGSSGGNGSTNHAPTGSLSNAFFIKSNGYQAKWTLKLTDYFHDEDGDPITFSNVQSSNPSVVTASLNGAYLTLHEAGVGSSIISVAYSDGRGGTGTATYTVTVLDKFIISEAYSLDSHRVLVKFDSIPAAGAFGRMDVNVYESYGAKDMNVFSGHMLRTTDELGKITVPESDRSRTAIFFIDKRLEASTVYKMKIEFFASDGSTFDSERIFAGDNTEYPFILSKARAVNNTSVELTFNDTVDRSTVQASSFSLVDRQTGQSVPIEGITINGQYVLTLTVPPLNLVPYQITVNGVKSAAGYSVSPVNDMNKAVFNGVPAGQPITSVTAFVYKPNELTLTFNQPVGASATDLSHYSISEIGRPLGARTGANPNEVVLTIPSLSMGVLYSIAIVDLENNVGIVSGLLDATFTASSDTNDPMPALLSIIAMDNQTVRLLFDRPVSSGDAWHSIWNGVDGAGSLLSNVVRYSDAIGEHDMADGHALIDSYNSHALIVRVPIAGAFSLPKSINRVFVGTVNTDVLRSTSSTGITFQWNDNPAVDISVSTVVALDVDTIRVTFNQAVIASPSIGHISSDSEGQQGRINLVSMIQVNEYTYDFKLASSLNQPAWVYYLHLDDGIKSVKSKLGFVSLHDMHPEVPAIQNYTMFAAPVSPVITNIAVLERDNRSIVVYYPEAMDPVKVLQTDYYSLYDNNNNPLGWELKDVTYDETNHIATLTLGSSLMVGGIYKLGIFNLPNAAGNKFTGDLKKSFAATNKPAPELSVTNVTYQSNSGIWTISLNMKAESSFFMDSVALSQNVEVNVVLTNDSVYMVSPSDFHVVAPTARGYTQNVQFRLNPDLLLKSGGPSAIRFKAGTQITGINGMPADTIGNFRFLQP